VSVLIAASAVRTCFGDGEATFRALLRGRSGASPLRYGDPARLGVTRGYHIAGGEPESPLRASRWLAECSGEALAKSGVDPARLRVTAIVGSGLREHRVIERFPEWVGVPAERLHFAAAIRAEAVAVDTVYTLANACSAGGTALALAQDLIELGQADAVVAAGTDAMTESMLAMIGRVADRPADQVRPFDADRRGVLLGEGAAAAVVVPEHATQAPLARLLGTGLSCDAHHETAPDLDGIERAMREALRLACRRPDQVDLVLAHGTGTALNDPTESTAISDVLAAGRPGPLVTAVKGGVGHTSGGSALLSLDVAIRCLRGQIVPPVVGLRRPVDRARGLRLVIGHPVPAELRLAQVNAFGFGGVNAVSLVEAVTP
jgi:3-oxoacyl-[acyl-carrier-protein] synthase II